jgi:hypothetical protein
MRCSGTLPFKKIGTIIYYDQDVVNAVLLPGQSRTLAFGRAVKKDAGL